MLNEWVKYFFWTLGVFLRSHPRPLIMTGPLAAFKLVAKFLQESNLKGIGIFMSNITVITLNKVRKRARDLLHTRISSLTLIT